MLLCLNDLQSTFAQFTSKKGFFPPNCQPRNLNLGSESSWLIAGSFIITSNKDSAGQILPSVVPKKPHCPQIMPSITAVPTYSPLWGCTGLTGQNLQTMGLIKRPCNWNLANNFLDNAQTRTEWNSLSHSCTGSAGLSKILLFSLRKKIHAIRWVKRWHFFQSRTTLQDFYQHELPEVILYLNQKSAYSGSKLEGKNSKPLHKSLYINVLSSTC